MKIFKIKQFFRNAKYRVSLIFSFPHFWICILIILLAIVSLWISHALYRSHQDFLSSIVIDRFEQVNGVTAIIRSFAVFDYLKAVLGSEENGYVIDSKVLCAADYGAPQKRMRFVVIGIKKSISEKIALEVLMKNTIAQSERQSAIWKM